MKILFVTYCRSMLGANRSMLNLIKDLRKRYLVEPVVLMSEVNDGDLENELVRNSISYIIGPMSHWVIDENKSLKLLRGLRTMQKTKRNTSEILSILSKVHDLSSFDLVYTNNSTVQTGACIAEKLGIPHIWHIREFGKKDYQLVFNYPGFLVNKMFRKASKVITVSESLREYVANSYAKGSNVKSIYNGVIEHDSYDALNPDIKKFSNDNDIIHFCFVGALQPGKNQLELLNAARCLLDKTDKFHIDLIGDGNEYKKMLENFVSDNDMKDYVTFWGYHKEILTILPKMDVGVICSVAEAFGRVTCEYMMSGLPVIGVKSAGTSEIIDDNETGLLYKSGDVNTLCQHMLLLMTNNDMRNRMGQKAKDIVNRKFTISANTDAIYEVICEIVSDK